MSYEDAPQSVIDLLIKVQTKYFPELASANIHVMFDTTERPKSWLAKIIKPSSLVRHLTADNLNTDGYDYIIVIDKTPWHLYREDDKLRTIRHELRHTFVKHEAAERNKQYLLVKHDIEDFAAEIELATEEGELRWRERASLVAQSEYERLKEQKKADKKAAKKNAKMVN